MPLTFFVRHFMGFFSSSMSRPFSHASELAKKFLLDSSFSESLTHTDISRECSALHSISLPISHLEPALATDQMSHHHHHNHHIRRITQPMLCGNAAVPSGDDDDRISVTLNASDGSIHCSNSGLSVLPPIPPNAQFL